MFNHVVVHFKINVLTALLFLHAIHSVSQPPVVFPLSLSSNHRWLSDNKGDPFLIKEFSAWGLIQALPERQERDFLDSIKKKGFNTVITAILCNSPSQMGGDPPYWQGISPFHVKWNFSTPNESYFQHVDRFFKIAEEKGFFVMALPCYIGYPGDASQGWWDEILNSKNDTVSLRRFGEFLGKRYAGVKNLMWVAGGDNNCSGDLFAYENNLIMGIRQFDTAHLWTGHFDTNLGVAWSGDHPRFGYLMDIDALYVWTESVLFEKGPQYKTELDHYGKGKMIMQLDQSYEHDVPHFADNENYQWIRRKMYDGLLSGCAGTSFSAGETNNQCYSFKNWRPLMNTVGMRQVSYCFNLFDVLPWQQLVPDQTDHIIIKGRGEPGSIDYICAARTTDSSCYIIYIPKGQPFEMNVNNISGKPMRMNWYNPRNGETIRIGVAETRRRFGITPPSGEDWILIFDDKSLKLPGS